jgi:hypothetical protein
MSLRAAMQSARRKGDDSIASLRLELTVSGACTHEQSFEQWSNDAHALLIQSFMALTTEDMHERWRYRGKR